VRRQSSLGVIMRSSMSEEFGVKYAVKVSFECVGKLRGFTSLPRLMEIYGAWGAWCSRRIG
jgi:hypothetical protein